MLNAYTHIIIYTLVINAVLHMTTLLVLWNLSVVDTFGMAQMCLLVKCPHSRGSLLYLLYFRDILMEGFHCIKFYPINEPIRNFTFYTGDSPLARSD